MSQENWTAADEYVSGLLAPHDEALEAALRASEEGGLPAIQVSPAQGKLLYLLAKSIGARQILEFGTLGGYSTIWLARALPADGRLVTLEAEPRNAEVAGRNLAHACLDDLVDLRVGSALDHSRPGSLIVSDNVVRFGELADPDSDDPTIPAQRRLHEMLAADPRVEATTIQTVGIKGHDGFNIALVIG